MNRLPKHHFWKWFHRYNKEYLALRTKPKKETTYLLNELNAHLRAYYKFFDFSLEWVGEQSGRLTITVNGKAAHFKKVDDLVAKAPAIPGWTIVALEDPRPIDFLLHQLIEDTGVDPYEFYFSFDRSGLDDAALVVYHPLCTPQNANLFTEIANRAVFNLLGERSFGNDIASLRVANLSCVDFVDVRELEVLPAYVGLRRSDMEVNPQGKLVMKDICNEL